MAQRHTISGRRSALVWLSVLVGLALIATLAVIVLFVYPNYQRQQQVEQQYQAGMAFQKASDWDKAVEAFEKVIAIDASYKDIRTRLTEVKARQREATDMDRAVAATATADAVEAHYQKGLAYMNLERWEEAKAELEQVFAADPNYKDVQAKLEDVATQLALVATRAPIATPPLSPSPTPIRTPTPGVISVVSAVGDAVATSPDEPFDLAATTAYQPYSGWARIPGASHIWYRDYRSGPLYFAKTIEVPAEATRISGTIQITADNFFNLWLNDVDYGGTKPPDTAQWRKIYTLDLTNLQPGTNQLLVKVTELVPGTSSMLIYNLTITYLLP